MKFLSYYSKRIATFMKNKILLFSLMVLFTNCEKDSQTIKYQEIDPGTPISVTNVTSDEISVILDLIGSSSGKVSKSGFTSTPYGDVELENILKVVDTIGNINYSLLLLPETDRPNSIFNLVISASQNGKPNSAIIEYRMDDNFVKGFMDGTKDFSEFTGTLYKYPFTSYSELFSKDTCVQNIDEIVICDETILNGGSSGGGGSTGNPLDPIGDGSGAGSSSGGGTIITASWVCDWRSSSHDSPNECTGPEGGRGPGTWTITIIPAPNSHTNKGSAMAGKELTCCDDSYVEGTVGVNLTVQAISDIVNCVGILATDQFQGLNSWPRKTIGLKNFLVDNNCSEEAREQGTQIIEALVNESLVSWFPFIKYPKPKAAQYKADYPKLTEYLMNQLPRVANITKITNAIKDVTRLPLETIKKDLQWDEGPVLEIVDFDNDDSPRTDSNTIGAFDPETPNTLYLNKNYVDGLEHNTSSQYEADALLFFIGVTILHEYVHYGDYENGNVYNFYGGPNDEGDIFEAKAYGSDLNVLNYEWFLLTRKSN